MAAKDRNGVYDNKKLLAELSELDVIDKDHLDESFKKAEKNKTTLGSVLISSGLIKKDILGKIIGDIISYPYANFDNIAISKKSLELIPEVVAQKHRIVSFALENTEIHLATPNTTDSQIIEFIQRKTGFKPVVYYTTEIDIDKALLLYSKDIGIAFKVT